MDRKPVQVGEVRLTLKQKSVPQPHALEGDLSATGTPSSEYITIRSEPWPHVLSDIGLNDSKEHVSTAGGGPDFARFSPDGRFRPVGVSRNDGATRCLISSVTLWRRPPTL